MLKNICVKHKNKSLRYKVFILNVSLWPSKFLLWQGISLLPSLFSTNRRPPSLSWLSSWSCYWSSLSSLSAIYGGGSVFSRNDLPNPAPPRASSTRMNTLWWWTGQSSKTRTMNTDFNRSIVCAIPWARHNKAWVVPEHDVAIVHNRFCYFSRCEISILFRLNFF